MNVSELFNLTYWITEEIGEKQVIGKCQNLISIIQTHVLSFISVESLMKDQLAFLDKLGIESCIREDGINLVEDILYKNIMQKFGSAI